MDELAPLRLLLPVIISKFHSLSSPVWMSACVHVRGQKVDAYRHVFPVALRCACACVHVCGRSCVSGSSPYFRGPDWSSRRTCRDLLRAARRYFWTVVLLRGRLLEELPFQNQMIFFFPGLVVWMMNFLFIAYEYKTTRL